jgi:cell fate regulator YaaT (PSP1 superfamily)
MLGQHFVRFGIPGYVGCFASPEGELLARGTRVILRTSRGVEIGQVLSPVDDDVPSTSPSDGTLLRRVTVEDDLLLARIEKHRDEAFHACQDLLSQRNIAASLVDVEHLFDGQSLFFYFVGQTPPELNGVTQELAETYDAQVEFRKFTETLTAGCGPGCGTEDAENGCGHGGCSTCVVASACSTRKRSHQPEAQAKESVD